MPVWSGLRFSESIGVGGLRRLAGSGYRGFRVPEGEKSIRVPSFGPSRGCGWGIPSTGSHHRRAEFLASDDAGKRA